MSDHTTATVPTRVTPRNSQETIADILQEVRELIKTHHLRQTVHIANSRIISVTYLQPAGDQNLPTTAIAYISTVKFTEYAHSLAGAKELLKQTREYSQQVIDQHSAIYRRWQPEFEKFRAVAEYYGYLLTYDNHSARLISTGHPKEQWRFDFSGHGILQLGQVLNHD